MTKTTKTTTRKRRTSKKKTKTSSRDESNGPLRVAVYYRVSTARQDLEMQKNAFRDWSKKQGELSVKTFSDLAKSGKTDRRPGWQRMMRQARDGRFDLVVCYRLDRFSRDAGKAIQTILELDERGVGFVAIDQPVLNLGSDAPFRKAILAIFAELAQMEREAIVSRVKAGLAAAKRRGQRLGRPPTIPEETRERVADLRKSGRSFRAIAEELGISLDSVLRIKNTAKIT